MSETQITQEEVCPMAKFTYAGINDHGYIFKVRCGCKDCPTKSNGDGYICLIPAHNEDRFTIIRNND